MSYEFYKILHILGLISLFSGFGVLLTANILGQKLAGKPRLFGFLAHGIGLTLILVSGFGMAARLGLVGGLPTWVHVKLGIWLVLGIVMALIKRKPAASWPIFFSVMALGLLAAMTAVLKPF